MPTPSKFTAETRAKITEALSVGASRRTAAAIAGVDESQIRRWMKRGEDGEDGSRFREFYRAVLEAEAAPRMRALGVIYRELPDNPALAWKFIERREPGFAPPMPNTTPVQAGPVVIQLSLSDGRPMLPETVIEVGTIEQDHEPGELPGAGTAS